MDNLYRHRDDPRPDQSDPGAEARHEMAGMDDGFAPQHQATAGLAQSRRRRPRVGATREGSDRTPTERKSPDAQSLYPDRGEADDRADITKVWPQANREAGADAVAFGWAVLGKEFTGRPQGREAPQVGQKHEGSKEDQASALLCPGGEAQGREVEDQHDVDEKSEIHSEVVQGFSGSGLITFPLPVDHYPVNLYVKTMI